MYRINNKPGDVRSCFVLLWAGAKGGGTLVVHIGSRSVLHFLASLPPHACVAEGVHELATKIEKLNLKFEAMTRLKHGGCGNITWYNLGLDGYDQCFVVGGLAEVGGEPGSRGRRSLANHFPSTTNTISTANMLGDLSGDSTLILGF